MKSSKKNNRQEGFFLKVFSHMNVEALLLLPVVLTAYAIAYGLHLTGHLPVSGSMWSGAHVVVILLVLISLPAAGNFGAVSARFSAKLIAVRSLLKRWHRREYAKCLLGIALLGVGLRYDAGILGLIVIAFGCAVILFEAVKEKVVYVLAATLLVAVPAFQYAGFQNAANGFAVSAFEVMVIAVLASAAKRPS